MSHCPTRVPAILETLSRIGCDFDQSQAASSLQEHGFCRTSFRGVRVDVFLPTIPFYERARERRLHVKYGDEQFYTWNAETLAV